MTVETIGERLYRKVIAPVYAADGTYTAGCIYHGENGAVSVRFYRYAAEGGIIGKGRPSDDMAGWLKRYGRELKEYINRLDAEEDAWARRSTPTRGRF